MAKHVLPKAAADGFADAGAYDAHRPSYPAGAVERLVDKLNLADATHARVVEIAAGTGKFTELLAARDENFDIVAVEPHEGMRARCAAKALKGVTVRSGYAASMPVEDEWGDACVAAQVSLGFQGENHYE